MEIPLVFALRVHLTDIELGFQTVIFKKPCPPGPR